MAISLGLNLSAIRAQRLLNYNGDRIAQIFERLASGKRINRPSDDPAGLAIATQLNAQQRVASVAIRNANDGISAVQIADGALSEITNILTRMAELAQQSANGAYNLNQRTALQLEFSALASEIERVSRTVAFNGSQLLDGSSNSDIQLGLNGGANSSIALPRVDATLAALGLAGTGSSTLTYSITANSSLMARSAALFALDAVTGAIDSVSVSRGQLGATESRLEVAINNLTTLRENLAAAESRIMDVDVAAEMAELTRLLILQQVGTGLLAQINQQPALALTLLRSMS
ncbi:MAG: flagellin FliC [Oligoflexia bacterium]|nr:flagellin FliC [Oligoflexia bacterium]